MTFTLTIDTDNAAFTDSDELIRLLRKVATAVENGDGEGPIIDANGNRVGYFEGGND